MRPKSIHEPVVLGLIILTSLVIGGALCAWLVRGLILERGQYFEFPGPRHEYQAATIWKGNLWYAVSTILPNTRSYKRRMLIHRRNIETGEDQETKLDVITAVQMVATEDRLWIIGGYSDWGTVYETDGQSVLRTAPSLPPLNYGPSGSRTFDCNYFVQDGVLSSVREYQPERYRIVHLVEDQWLDGSEVILPGRDRLWEDNLGRDRKVFAPRASTKPATPGTSSSTPKLIVIPDQGHLHLVHFDLFGTFMAYREGFEFVETREDSVSALLPQNTPPEASGWEYVGEKSYMPFHSASLLGGVPVIASGWQAQQNGVTQGPHKSRVWMRTARDRFDVIGDLPSELMSYPIIVTPPNHDECFLLGIDPMQGADVFAVDETGLRKLPHRLPGHEWPMIGWFVRLGLALGAAWLTHLVVIVGGMSWFRPRAAEDGVIVSGHGSATHGAVPRRAVARGVDLALILLPMVLYSASLISTADPVAVAHELSRLETQVRSIPHNNVQGNYNMLIRNNWPYYFSAYATMQWSLLGSLAVWFALVAVEGAWGVTPGKWLCGLRTLRTTLRPCGLARTILRDALVWLDIPLLLTPIPAAISCVLSPYRQRWGDRFADTVVVEAESLREGVAARDERRQSGTPDLSEQEQQL